MSDLEKRINDFNKLTGKEKIEKLIFILSELKDKSDDFLYVYNYVYIWKNNIKIPIVDKLYKTISEAIIYQNSLDKKKKEQNNINIKEKLLLYKREEETERLLESQEIENTL